MKNLDVSTSAEKIGRLKDSPIPTPHDILLYDKNQPTKSTYFIIHLALALAAGTIIKQHTHADNAAY